MSRLSIDKMRLGQLGGAGLARLIRLVWRTSRVTMEPAGFAEQVVAGPPVIFALWHGQFMMVPAVKPHSYPIRIMVARHGDAEMFAQALAGFNAELIRGAGAGARRRDRGGAQALREAVRGLEEGVSVAMTADVPPGPARRAGLGIVTLARLSGCRIVPMAVATSRYTTFDTWSRMTINLPFSRLGVVFGQPIEVGPALDADGLEAKRREVEVALDAATTRAYALAGADARGATPATADPHAPPPPPGWRLRTYRGLMRMATPAAPIVLGERQRRGKEDLVRLPERMGNPSQSRPPGPLVWVHAASVGEMNAVLPVIAGLCDRRPNLHCLLTSGTVTSAEVASRRIGPRTIHQFVPVDTPSFVSRFLDHWKPDLGVFTESEIWPNLILEASGRNVPLVLVNGRISPKSFKRWRRNKAMSRPLFARFSLILAQSEKLARMYTELGGRRVEAVGNLKIDAPPPPVDVEAQARLQSVMGNRPRLLAASTHEGEEEVIAAAHARIARDVANLLTIIVPRHPERGAAIATALRAAGLAVRRRSLGELPDETTEIYLADTLGELGTFYALCPVAFVGGSFADRGGQNPIEAIRHHAVVLTGPHWQNFVEPYRQLLAVGGALEVRDAETLAAAAVRLFGDPAEVERMRSASNGVIASLSGALDATLEALLTFLPPQDDGLRRVS